MSEAPNRIVAAFRELRQAGRTGLLPFITAGYPDLETTGRLLRALAAGGASVVELGIPFSDPIADGPVIAASMHEALKRGFRLPDLFDTVRAARRDVPELGIVAMVSYSIVHRVGVREFIGRCGEAGFDGFIFPDLPCGEAGEAVAVAAGEHLTCSLLIAPTTSAARAAEAARQSSGFVYLMARLGITGEQSDTPDVAERVKMLRQETELPIACGFGIAGVEAVAEVTRHADAAIVGSALVRRITEWSHTLEPRRVAVEVEQFTRELASGLSTRMIGEQ